MRLLSLRTPFQAQFVTIGGVPSAIPASSQQGGVPNAIQRALLAPLRHRPLLWMTMAALAGVALGGWWALSLSHKELGALARSDWRLVLAWPLALFALGLTWVWRGNGLAWRLAWAIALACFFCGATARRLAPPDGDVSQLTRTTVHPLGAIEPLEVTLRGLVAAPPQRGEFNTQFLLQCLEPSPGRVWVKVKPNAPVHVGDEVRFKARLLALDAPLNPGEPISYWSLVQKGCWCSAERIEAFRRVRIGVAYPLERQLEGVRRIILSRVEATLRGDGSPQTLSNHPFPGATAQLLTAMVFGQGGLSRPLPAQVSEDFRSAGLSHLLVASGAQCGIVLGIILFLGRGLRFPSWLILLLGVPALGMYALVVGGSSSIARATLAALVVAVALVVGREKDGLSIWSAALLASLCFDPSVAWNIGWQLTFAATWGLIVVAPMLEPAQESSDRSKFLDAATMTLGAQIAVAPICLFHFKVWSMSGLCANLVALPVAETMVVTGAAGLVVTPLAGLNYWLTRFLAFIAHQAATFPGASLEHQRLSLPQAWLFYGILGLALTFRGAEMRKWAKEEIEEFVSSLQARFQTAKAGFNSLFALGVLLLLTGGLTWWRLRPAPAQLRLVMLDVGQGEALVVISPRGRAILVDGGSLDNRGDVGESVIVPALQALGVERLEAVFLTHADADHCNGLASVLREVPVEAFVDGVEAAKKLKVQQNRPAEEFGATELEYQTVLREAERKDVPQTVPTAGQTWEFDGAKVTALAPLAPPLESENDNCLVLRIEWGQSALLLTGDISSEAEERLVSRGSRLQANVLKVSHHGSAGSSSPLFLHAATPQIALISCGKYNRFGHPKPETLKRLRASGTREFRTDLDGAIEVDCDQSQCRAFPTRERH